MKRIKLIYFLKYKNIIEILKSSNDKNKSFISYINKNAYNRLYNGLKTRRDNLEKLSQKYLLEEAKKYTYFPEINKYDLIFQNYYVINNNIDEDNSDKDNYDIQESNTNMRYVGDTNTNPNFEKVKNDNDVNFFTYNDEKTNDKFFKDNMKFNNKNLTIKNNYYNSIIKKNLSLLNSLEREEEKINNKTIPNIIHYKNTIPTNYKNRNKFIKDKKSKTNQKDKEIRNNSKTKNNDNQNQKVNLVDFDNLTSYYPSPVLKRKINDDLLTKYNSYQNSEANEEKSKNNNSYFARSTNVISNHRYNLSPNNFHYISKSGLPTIIHTDCSDKNKIFSNTYKYLPRKICSLVLEGIKYYTNINSDSSRKNKVYNKRNYYTDKNKIGLKNNLKYRQFNSLGLIDNSLSTNFIERPSLNENNTISINDNNNQHSFIYNKINKNISYSFPSKEVGTGLNKNDNYPKQIYFKKINNFKKISTKEPKRTFNRVTIERNLDNNENYNTIKTNSSSNKPKININENNKEKIDDFNLINELLDEKLKKRDKLKIISRAVNENVNNRRNKHENILSMSQESEPITIQSMSDSKIFEIANYYLNEEETVDKIQIGDILSTKNSKSIKEKKSY